MNPSLPGYRPSFLLLVVTAFWLAGCGGSEHTATAVRGTVIESAEVVQETDGAYRLQWTAPPQMLVEIFAGTDPANIPHTNPVARTTEAEATISGLEPNPRYYYELIGEGGQGHIVATRFVEFEGACNFRDLGGHATADGRRVRWGTVFRSDALHNLTDNDLTLLSNMGIRMVCDLRRDSQREEEPDRLPRENPPGHTDSRYRQSGG